MLTEPNPFVLNGYVGDNYFCNRHFETRALIDLLNNGNNVVLTAPRRIGKSDFISHVFSQNEIKERYTTIAVDVYATKSLEEFVEFLGKSILKALQSKGKALVEGFIRGLKSLQSQITLDYQGIPSFGIGVNPIKHPEITLDEIFEYLAHSEHPCIVAIDEFQQIERYDDPWRVEALLRTHIQKCPKTRFVFSGSIRHLMTEIFNSPARPFYGSVAFMSLPKLDQSVYAVFCQRLFGEYGKRVDAAAVAAAYSSLNGITAYVQRVMNKLFAMTPEGKECMPIDVATAIDSIITANNDVYSTMFNMLSERQRGIMIAIAKEGEASNVQGAGFISKYGLGTASMVASAVKALLDKDMLTLSDGIYSVYDRFFAIWIARTFA